MKRGDYLYFAIAALCGAFGGMLASHNSAEASSDKVVRTSRLELQNRSGTLAASLEADQAGVISIRFGVGESPPMQLGVLADGRPFLRLRGRDGKIRVSIGLNQTDEPTLEMSDQKWEGRVILGFTNLDAPSPGWDSWGLRFCGVGSTRTIAGIGIPNEEQGVNRRGFLSLSGTTIYSIQPSGIRP